MLRINNFKILFTILLFSSCFNKRENFQKYDTWEKIIESVEKKNIEYLLEISADTLQCLECNNGGSWVTKEDFFNKNIEQMKLPKNEVYTYFVERIQNDKGFSQRVRINYLEKNNGNEYNIIYTILKGEKKVRFLGVFSVP